LKLLNECRATGTALTIGGDDHADSLGNSAKFGSYGIIDLTINSHAYTSKQNFNLSIICCALSYGRTTLQIQQKECPFQALKFLGGTRWMLVC